MLTEDDMIALASQEPAELARGWCLLNSWGWPEWLPNPMRLEDRQQPGLNRARVAMLWITKRVGERVISREWNRDTMTDDEHEDFWRGTVEGDADARARYETRLERECAALEKLK